MLTVLVLALLVLAVSCYTGTRLVLAGRQLDRAPEAASHVHAPDGSLAAKVDARLQRTRSAVETLVMVDGVDEDDIAPSPGAYRDRAQTYGVLGACLLGIAGVVLVGVLLLL